MMLIRIVVIENKDSKNNDYFNDSHDKNCGSKTITIL